MPQVPNYRSDQVRTNPIAGTKKSAVHTPESLGGQFGETAARLGQQLYRQAEERAVQRQTLTAERELMEAERVLVDDPARGVLRTRGLAAMEAYEPTLETFDRFASEIQGRVKNPRAQAGVELLVARRRAAVADRVGIHGSRELERHDQREHEAMLNALVDEGITYAGEESRIDETLARLSVEVDEASERFGLGAEAKAAVLAEKRTALHAGVIDRLVAAGRDGDAEAYLKRFREQNQIAGHALPELERKVDVASTDAAAARIAGVTWAQFGPKGDTDPIALDKMEDELRGALSDQPKILAAAIRLLRERKAGVDASRNERQDAMASDLWKAVAEGRPLEQIQRLPSYLSAPGKLQAEISEHVVRQREQRADRGYQLGQRAKSQREDEAERRGAALYWELRRPDVLAMLSENAIIARSGELGSERAERLLRAKQEGGGPLRDATIDREVLDQVLRRSQLTFTDDQRGDLLVAVEDAIDRAQQAAGNKKLTRDDARAIAQGLVDDRVMVDTWGPGGQERVRALVVDADDRKHAYIPLDRIPPALLAEALETVRGFTVSAQRPQGMSDAELRRRFGRRIERAFAIGQLGGTKAEQVAILRGEQ